MFSFFGGWTGGVCFGEGGTESRNSQGAMLALTLVSSRTSSLDEQAEPHETDHRLQTMGE